MWWFHTEWPHFEARICQIWLSLSKLFCPKFILCVENLPKFVLFSPFDPDYFGLLTAWPTILGEKKKTEHQKKKKQNKKQKNSFAFQPPPVITLLRENEPKLKVRTVSKKDMWDRPCLVHLQTWSEMSDYRNFWNNERWKLY